MAVITPPDPVMLTHASSLQKMPACSREEPENSMARSPTTHTPAIEWHEFQHAACLPLIDCESSCPGRTHATRHLRDLVVHEAGDAGGAVAALCQ